MIRIGVLRLNSILGAVFGALDDRTMPLARSVSLWRFSTEASMRSLIAISTALLVTLPVQSQVGSNELLYWCEDTGSADQSMCVGYFAGLQNSGAIWSAKAEIEDSEKLHCASSDVTPDIHLRVWQKFVKENPEMLAKAAIESYLAAMRDAFPCEESLVR